MLCEVSTHLWNVEEGGFKQEVYFMSIWERFLLMYHEESFLCYSISKEYFYESYFQVAE